MMGPLASIRRRFSHRLSVMIDWRVRKAFEDERTIILDTNKTVVEISIALTDRIAVLETSLMDLRKEVDSLRQIGH